MVKPNKDGTLDACGICSQDYDLNFMLMKFEDNKGRILLQKVHSACWHNANVFTKLKWEIVSK